MRRALRRTPRGTGDERMRPTAQNIADIGLDTITFSGTLETKLKALDPIPNG